MGDDAKELNVRLTTLLTRGDEVLDALRSVTKEADQSQRTFLRDAPSRFDEVDTLIDKLGIGGVVRPALDHFAAAWLGVLQREVRFFDLVSEIEAIHEELFALVNSGDSR